MRQLHWTLLTLCLLPMPTSAQPDPQTALQDALALENRGSFETAAKVAKAAIDSRRLTGNELGNGYVILAVACQGTGDLADSQNAFEHALQVLKHDREHPEDYATALENYAGFYSDLEKLEVAARIWRKAFHVRQNVGDHTGIALLLTRMAELALARNRIREAHRYFEKASREMKASPNLVDDDKAFFLETEGWLASAEHHDSASIAAFQHSLELVERSRGEQHWLAGWDHMLLGKAFAESGDLKSASASMQTGLKILEHALGQKNPKYFDSELAYAQVLDQLGSHAEASEIRAAGEKASKDYHRTQCVGCTINTAALR